MSYEEEGKELIASEMALKQQQAKWEHEYRMAKVKRAFINPMCTGDWVALTAVVTTIFCLITWGIVASTLS